MINEWMFCKSTARTNLVIFLVMFQYTKELVGKEKRKGVEDSGSFLD